MPAGAHCKSADSYNLNSAQRKIKSASDWPWLLALKPKPGPASRL